MPQPSTVFDSPKARLVPDEAGLRSYGNVSNRLEVERGGRAFAVAVAVPTELFTFMRQVARIPAESPVSLGIVQEDEWYVFYLLAGDEVYDLWCYSEKSLPSWILDRSNRLA